APGLHAGRMGRPAPVRGRLSPDRAVLAGLGHRQGRLGGLSPLAQVPGFHGVECRVTGRIRATLTIGASLLGSMVLAVAPATHAAAASPAWLDRFNAWRANANVPALSENTTWDQGDYN